MYTVFTQLNPLYSAIVGMYVCMYVRARACVEIYVSHSMRHGEYKIFKVGKC
jgi:hypothetical protein